MADILNYLETESYVLVRKIKEKMWGKENKKEEWKKKTKGK